MKMVSDVTKRGSTLVCPEQPVLSAVEGLTLTVSGHSELLSLTEESDATNEVIVYYI